MNYKCQKIGSTGITVVAMMDNSIQIPLDLPNIFVLEGKKTKEGDWLILLESTLQSTLCRKCGREITRFHGFDKAIKLRHL